MKKRCLVLPIIFDLQDLEQLHFLAWSYKTDEKIAFNWKKKRKHYPRILILFFLISRLVNSSTLIFFLILIPWNTEKLKWQYDHTIISANFSTVIFWVWINLPLPTFDLTFNQLCPITHHSPKIKTFLMVLLSSPAVITTRTAFCNMTRVG